MAQNYLLLQYLFISISRAKISSVKALNIWRMQLRESGISGNAQAIGGISEFFTNLQFLETAQ